MKALLTHAYRYTDDQINKIQGLGYETFLWKNESELISNELKNCEIVVCNNLFINNDISNFSKLRMIQLTSSGIDRFPLNKIMGRSIQLANARGVYSIPIAEWVILKILEIYKNTRFFECAQRRTEWIKNRELLELNSKTVGIIGTGSIGMEVAKRLKAFGTTVWGLNTSGSKLDYFDRCMAVNDFSLFLNSSDVVVLTLPLTEKTKNLINKDTLDCLRENAIIINVSRGGIINEDDLLNHLNKGKIKGVALDVFEKEPLPVNNPLWNHPRVLITPHNSFVSDNVTTRIFELIYNNLKLFIENKPLVNQIEIR